MRVLLTGASGFLGRHIVPKLKSEGYEITAFVRPSSDIDHLRAYDIDFAYGELRDEQSIAKAVQEVDVVIHAATTMGGSWDVYERVNVKSTELLLKYAKLAGVDRFIFISSVMVYDHSSAKDGKVFTEGMPYETGNLTHYSRSKIEAEKIVQRYHREHGVPTVILRPAALYGPGGTLFLPRLGISLGKRNYLVIGKGNLLLPLSHVGGTADAVLRCIRKDNTVGKCYNLVEDDAISQEEYLERLRERVFPDLRIFRIPYPVAGVLARTARMGLTLLGKEPPTRLSTLNLNCTPFFYSNQQAKEDSIWRSQPDLDESINEMFLEFKEKRKPKRSIPIKKGRIILPTDEKLRVGIVGCGLFAETHLSILQRFKNAQVVALCDPNVQARKEQAKKFNVSRTYSTLNEMLSHHSIDVVHILTPPQSHARLSIEAMKNKCHVLVEKPMALNAEEAEAMVRAAEENNVKLCVDHNHLFDDVMIKARDLIADRSIGRIAYVESWYATAYSSNTKSRYLQYDARDHWVYQLPGSLYQNMISHPISLLTDVMNEVNGAKVKASAEYMHVVPHMRTDELRALIEGNNILGSLCMSLTVSPRYHFLNIYGTKGTLKLDFLNKYLFFDKSIPVIPKVISRNLMNVKYALTLTGASLRNMVHTLLGKYTLFEGNERLIHLFYRSILLGEPVPVSPQEGVQSMEIMDRLWDALDEGVVEQNAELKSRIALA